MTLRDHLKLYYQHNSQGEMGQGGTRTSALTGSTVGPACKVCDSPRHSSCSSLVLYSCLCSCCLLYAVCLSVQWAHSGVGWAKNPLFHVIDILKLEVSKLLWISIPRLCVLKVALSQRRENRGWPIYEGISSVPLYCFIWVTIIEWSDTFIHNNIYFICELSVPAAVLW